MKTGGTLYPSIEPFHTEMLKVSELHEVYLEQSGNPEGKAVIFVHGGPGAGTDPECQRLFDPSLYRIVLFDQRGRGKSRPKGNLEENTTWDLIRDMEQIREHLGIETWLVFGGSWGSTLGLAYSINHQRRVSEIVLRGIFLVRRKEIEWFYQHGAHVLFPDLFEPYIALIPEEERHDVISAYYKQLTDEDHEVRMRAARAWGKWEGSMLSVIPDPDREAYFSSDDFAEAFARVECHYFYNRGFFPSDNYLLENIDIIRHIPTVMVQGRYDVITPFQAAWDLHGAFPEADFKIADNAGHAVTEPGIRRELIRATDRFSA